MFRHFGELKDVLSSYMGRSTAKQGLGLWTHHLRDIQVQNSYHTLHYSGAAIRMGAGTLASELNEAAHNAGLRATAGFCPSVGVAGGYTQGGGHGPLAGGYGLAADAVLQWEVVTADGQLLIASPVENRDLYWALSGGGAGNYGLIVSLTVRAYPDGPVAGASVNWPAAGLSRDTYWAAFSAWQELLPKLTSHGITAGYAVLKDFFFIQPITALNHTSDQLSELLTPFFEELDTLGVSYNENITQANSYYEHYANYMGPLPTGLFTIHHLFGGSMIPRQTLTEHNKDLALAVRNITENTDTFLGFVALDLKPAQQPVAPNAVNPVWRKTIVTVLAQYTWDFNATFARNKRGADQITYEVVPQLQAVTKTAGVYMNEADFQHENWQEDFFGDKYARLRRVKHRYDPHGVFYAFKTPGSEDWELEPDSGSLCRAKGARNVDAWRRVARKVDL